MKHRRHLWLLAAATLAFGGCTAKTSPSADAKGGSAPVEETGALEAFLGGQRNKDLKVRRGAPCPSFAYTTMDGKTVRLEDFKGKALLVDIFSPT